MKQIMYIPPGRTILNWFMTLVIGSFCWPIIDSLSGRNGSTDAGSTVVLMLLSLMFIGLVLIPQLILLLIANSILNKKNLTPARFFRVYTAVNGGTGLLTFLIIYILDGPSTNLEETFFFLAVSGSYLLIGLAIWMITFRMYCRNKNFKANNEELLDEL
jgi:hypothetical protein